MERYKISIITDEGMYCFFLPQWYCKPTILESICYFETQRYMSRCVEIHNFICARYPWKQIYPKFHKEFAIYDLVETFFDNDDRKMVVPVFK